MATNGDSAPRRQHPAMGAAVLVCLLALLSGGIFAGSAAAETVEIDKYNGVYPAGSFDGHDANGAGTFGNGSIREIDIDQSTGNPSSGDVYVGNTNGHFYKFDSSGVSQPFSALSPATVISQAFSSFCCNTLKVDNSSTATQGRIYSFAEASPVKGWLPTGAPLGAPFPAGGITGFSDNCGAAVGPNGHIWVADYNNGLKEFTSNGVATGEVIHPSPQSMCNFTIDSQGNFYVPTVYSGGPVIKYDPTGHSLGQIDPGPAISVAIDLSNDDVYVDDGDRINHYNSAGELKDTFGLPNGSYPGLSGSVGVAVNENTHTVYVANNRTGGTRVDTFVPSGPITIPTVSTDAPEPTSTSATLKGTVNGDGVDTTECKFEWGATSSYGNTTACLENGVPTNVFTGGSGDHAVTASIGPLTKGSTYHFRIVAKNANEVESRGKDVAFNASSKPAIGQTTVSHVNTDGVQFDTSIDPEGGNTTFKIEYGTEAGVYGSSAPASEEHLASVVQAETFHIPTFGLTFGTTYHYRVVAKNDAGTTNGPDQVFTTYFPDPGSDPCPNAQVRQQTESSLLPDCRAYELASARNTGGYDVESDIVPGQTPLVTSPRAGDRILYSIHFGLIPGAAGSPTNYGRDPYVATRGTNGWTTKYVGLPADGMADSGAFGSPLLGTDSALSTFAFGGEGICEPCYGDGSINEPLRRPDGILEKGMAGSSNPAADPAGEVRKPLSDDGSHLVFGAEKKFELAGNEGSPSIYDRNLETGLTQVVSTLENGDTMSGEVGELDISEDGSRIVVGELISTDSKGNEYWHLYMHIGTSPESVDLTPGASEGVLYDGMSGDGSRVFFTTKDHLLGADTDNSADIYEAAIDGNGNVNLRLITTKGGVANNDDSCTPAGIPNSWNTVSGEEGECNAVAFAGGAGVASGNGTFYFVSPELLDGVLGKQNQANLYIVKPGGDPEFVRTIDTSEGTSPPPPAHPVVKSEFGGALSSPGGLAVDEASGDVYVPQFSSGKVTRFKPDGTPDNFSALGSNSIGGFTFGFSGARMAQVAVDNSPGPANGRFYVASGGFGSSKVSVYAPNGNLLTTLTGSGTPEGGFGLACGVAVDQSDGSVYVGDAFGKIWRYTPSGATVTEADYSGGIETGAFFSCGVAAAAGKVYVNQVSEEEVLKFPTSAFALGPPPAPVAVHLATGTQAVATDPGSGDVYLDEGNHLTVLNSSGTPTGLVLGTGQISGSAGVAVNGANHHVFATRAGAYITEFGYEQVPYTPIDNPAIVHGVNQSGTHSYGDFQVTPNGRYAVFNSDQPLTGFATLGFGEIYRYDSVASQLDCVTCPETGASPLNSTSLAKFGLGLTDDGRVFFTSRESFTLRDTNEKLDAYEWSGGKQRLISTGIGSNDSGLMSVSADGVNAFFYTRDTLSPEDENGSAVKVYDAREGGGFLFDPARPPCAASDECHGAGSPVPAPPNINTRTGSEHQNVIQPTPTKPCPKGKVKRHGKCVKPHRRHKSTRRHG
jgi:sugar lactone lactonase YvrE